MSSLFFMSGSEAFQNFEFNQGHGFKIILNCPVCHAHYNPLLMRVIEENDEGHLLHIECHKCGSLVLALVLINMPNVSSMGLLTDLQVSEIKKFKESNAVSLDDLIDLHYFMEHQDNIC